MAPNLEALLAALRGEDLPAGGEAWAPDDALTPLRQRVEELERRIVELAALPEESVPPAPPTELALFLQARMELMENKLELAQRESLRANLLLRERDDAQRKAQREVEDIFHSIREQQRAAGYDGVLRERVRELESRLSLAELSMIPVEEALQCLERTEGQAELKARLAAQLEKIKGLPPQAPAPPEDSSAMAVVLGRVSDLERRLEEERDQKEKERQARLQWENNLLAALKQVRSQWQRSGGPEVLVEATLEDLVESLRQRDAIQGEVERIVCALRDEPLDSPERPALHARLEECRARMDAVQGKLDQQMSVVQAWTGRGNP